MAEQISVTVTVNGRRYAVACDEGQAEQLRRLASELDARIARLAAGMRQAGQERLLLLAGLLLADELAEARRGLPAKDAGPASGDGIPAGGGGIDGELHALARRIETLVNRLQAATAGDEAPHRQR